MFAYYADCRFLGASLRIYGEWSEDEVRMYDALLTPTDIVIEVGANVGALTVPLSRRCKRVLAFEPQPENFELFLRNLKVNDVHNVDAFHVALGAFEGEVTMPTLKEMDEDDGVIGNYGGPAVGMGTLRVPQQTIDGLNGSTPTIKFMKMDCEGSELDVLIGAEKLVKRDRPLIYAENLPNNPREAALLGWLKDHDYECFWHRPPLFEETNFKKYQDNIFGPITSHNIICYPKGYQGPTYSTTEPVSG